MPTHLNVDYGDGGLGLVELPSHPVHGLRDKVQHQIQIHLIFLQGVKKEACITAALIHLRHKHQKMTSEMTETCKQQLIKEIQQTD